MNTPTHQFNPQLDMALDYVVNTNKSVFLTGKAGTGKTTFLHRLKENTPKRIAIVAPTGVAAINAGGVTIHSLFQLPFGPFIPQSAHSGSHKPLVEMRKFNRDKINLIKSIDLLVIDEISMVRCDVLDAIDSVLRQFRNRYKPFGGVQLLLIGDINQLAPVAKDDEWELLREHYDSVFFFSSHALKENFPVIVELRHIFRQSDTTFIDLLNKVRNNNLDDEAYHLLNSRLDPEIFANNNYEGYITLSSHNSTARQINQDRLERLDGESFFYKATVWGDFSEYSFPTDENLELKLGAQVMFIKNDSGREKRYFNGKIGKIVKIDTENITVATDEHDAIEVTSETWSNIKYTLNETTKAIEENTIGEFKQFPLKLAYAITIHKSQGLTFDKVIIDAQAAFSSGQVYVALSRCRTLEGIILSSPILSTSVRLDYTIHKFNGTISEEDLNEGKLQRAKYDYQESLLMDLLDYNALQTPLANLRKHAEENSPPIDSKTVAFINEVFLNAQTQIGQVLSKFQKQIKELLTQGHLPENNDLLKDRLQKGAVYFDEKINTVLILPLKDFGVVTDNKAIREGIQKALEAARKAIYIKSCCFKYCLNEFSAIGFIQAKVNAEIDFDKKRYASPHPGKVILPRGIHHAELYVTLREMRSAIAKENDVAEYQIFQQKALIGILNTLPLDLPTLESINGIGQVTSKRFGAQLIEAVKQYCEKNNIVPDPVDLQNNKPRKEIGYSAKQSYEMFLQNIPIPEIAKQRGFAESTINGHLAEYVSRGLLNVEQFLSTDKIEKLTDYYTKNPEALTAEAMVALGNEFSYTDFRFFFSYRKNKDQNPA